MLCWHFVLLALVASTSICSAQESSNSSCYLPDCRHCDILDLESCTCTKVYLKCAQGFHPSEDGCTCIESNSISPYCPDLVCPPELNLNEARCECTEKVCNTFAPCQNNFVLDIEACECVCTKTAENCPPNSFFDNTTCNCYHEYQCFPDVWFPGNADWDAEFCKFKCTQIKICADNFIFKAKTCDCEPTNVIEPPTKASVEFSSSSSSQECDLSSCRWCDYADYDNCKCYQKFTGCAKGFVIPEYDNCSCIDENYASLSFPIFEPCPDVKCESGYGPDLRYGCLCISDDCYFSPYCPNTHTYNPDTCECTCENYCAYPYILNAQTCQCEHYCPDQTCPGEMIFIQDYCECFCAEYQFCDYGWYFDFWECKCKRYDFSEPSHSCEMTEPCPEHHYLNFDSCRCECVEFASCIEGYIFSSNECKCIPSSEPPCNITDCYWPNIIDDQNCVCIESTPSCDLPDCNHPFIVDTINCVCLIPETSPESCDLSDCRWCDFADYDHCQCYRRYIDCVWPFTPSDDGCSCIPPWDIETSSSHPDECVLPDCRWCDHPDYENCVCQRKPYDDCYLPYFQLSYDGCECIPTDYMSSSTSCTPLSCPSDTYWNEYTCSCESYISTSTQCNIPDCRPCDYLDEKECICFRIQIDCAEGFKLNDEGCDCIPMVGWGQPPSEYTSSSIISFPSSSQSPCELPDCRWCDFADYENCICYKKPIACMWPDYQLSDDGCTCLEISETPSYTSCEQVTSCNSNEYWDINTCSCLPLSDSAPSFCYIPDCRWCDYMDYQTCECYRIAIDCLIGYELSEDGCTCIQPSNCSAIDCPLGTKLEESLCTCVEFNCDAPPSCPPNTVLDKESCSCVCELQESQCPQYYIYDPVNCICRHPPCDPPGPCPNNTDWNPENCRCECQIRKKCKADYIFDLQTCECVLPGSSYNSASSKENSETKISESYVIDYPESSPLSSSKISSESYTKFESMISPSPCDPSSVVCKKWCDLFDYETCQCYELIYDCWYPYYKLRPDGCGCIETNVSRSSCSEIFCDIGYDINYETCECVKKTCDYSVSCPPNQVMNAQTCECSCALTQDLCPPFHIFDDVSCICRHPPCLPPGPCPGRSSWDSEACRCKCDKNIDCGENSYLDLTICDCESTNSSSKSSELSISSPIQCSFPKCRWCDIADYERCECYTTVVDCFPGYELSSDECSCVESPSTSPNCPNVYCDRNLGLYIDERSCKCISFSTPSSSGDEHYSSSSSSDAPSSSCILPSCRWCDVMDQENCVCYHRYVDCMIGYELTPDGCDCVKSNETEISSDTVIYPSSDTYKTRSQISCTFPTDCRWCDIRDYDRCICTPPKTCDEGFVLDANCDKCERPSSGESVSTTYPTDTATTSSGSSCVIPDCRSCDRLDYENCVCHKTYVDCFSGYILSEDGCSCIKANVTSDKCPGIYCGIGTYLDELRCECMNDKCKAALECPPNLMMDSKTCECFCNLSPWKCPRPYIYDAENCKCRHPVCDPPAPCPGKQSWDPENCKCACDDGKVCSGNFTLDSINCECICDTNSLNTTCSSGSVFDELLCDCIEEIDCTDSDDPACSCECVEILECPGKKQFDMEFCECMCPIGTECKKGFKMDEETCECVREK